MNAIEVLGLTKAYKGINAVSALNLSVEKGELFSLLGVNGAGKTTTIKLLSCLIRPTRGDATLMGNSIVRSPNKVKASINVSPQETAVAPNLTAEENLRLICGIYGAKVRADAAFGSFGLERIAKSRAKILSGGWQRRLSIAMALISEPKVLFLDEPTLGLDVLVRRELWGVIEGLKGQTTIMLTTHYLEEAEALSSRIGIMSEGNLVAVGTSDELRKTAGRDSFEDAFVELCTKGGRV